MQKLPLVSIPKKRFNSKTGQLLDSYKTSLQQINSNAAAAADHQGNSNAPSSCPYSSVVEMCDSLCVPLEYIGKLVRTAREAKVLLDCTMTAQKLKALWPALTVALTAFHVESSQCNGNSIESSVFSSSTNMSPYLSPFLVIMSTSFQKNQHIFYITN